MFHAKGLRITLFFIHVKYLVSTHIKVRSFPCILHVDIDCLSSTRVHLAFTNISLSRFSRKQIGDLNDKCYVESNFPSDVV